MFRDYNDSIQYCRTLRADLEISAVITIYQKAQGMTRLERKSRGKEPIQIGRIGSAGTIHDHM